MCSYPFQLDSGGNSELNCSEIDTLVSEAELRK